MCRHPVDAPVVPPFEWHYEGRIVVLDNGARMPRLETFDHLMALNAFAVVVFDPASLLHDNEHVRELPEFQVFAHATLGSGESAVLYACLDPLASATIKPAARDDLSARERTRREVLAELPISTVRLDAIEGLDCIDWLLLDDHNDAMAALAHGTAHLGRVSLADIRIPFGPGAADRPDAWRVIPWMQEHGFTFHGFAAEARRSLLPADAFFARDQATRWESADALFLPDAARLARLEPARITKLACIADLAYGMHDLAADLLGRVDAAAARRYLDARGYLSGYYKEPDVFTLTAMNAPAPWDTLHTEAPLAPAEPSEP